jgi:hypothetical protein
MRLRKTLMIDNLLTALIIDARHAAKLLSRFDQCGAFATFRNRDVATKNLRFHLLPFLRSLEPNYWHSSAFTTCMHRPELTPAGD